MYAIAKITHKKFHLIIGMFLDCTNHKLGWPKKCITRNFYHGPKPKIVIFWVRFNFKASIGYFRMLPVYKVVKIFGLGFHDFGQVWLNSPTLNGRTPSVKCHLKKWFFFNSNSMKLGEVFVHIGNYNFTKLKNKNVF